MQQRRAFGPGPTWALILLGMGCTSLDEQVLRGDLGVRPFRVPTWRRTLPSGLRIIVQEDHRSPIVAVVAVIGEAGAAAAPPGQAGLPSLVARLTRRARQQPPYALAELFEQAGAAETAATAELDEAVFCQVAPRAALPALLRLESARLLAPLAGVSPAELAEERAVLQNDLRSAEETGTRAALVAAMRPRLFPPGHPYARTAAAARELGGLGWAQAVAFAEAHYRPERTTWLVAGDVSAQQVAAALEGALPPALGGRPDRQVTPQLRSEPDEPPAPPAARLERRPTLAARPELWVGWSLPGDDGAATGAAELLSDSVAQIVRSATPWVDRDDVDDDLLDVEPIAISGAQGSMILLRLALLRGAHPERTAAFVLDRLSGLWTRPSIPALLEGPSRRGSNGAWAWSDLYDRAAIELFGRTRARRIIDLLLDLDDLPGRLPRVGRALARSADLRVHARHFASLAGVSSARLESLAYRYLRRQRARFLYLDPSAAPAAAPGPVPAASGQSAAAASEAERHLPRPVALLPALEGAAALSRLHTVRLPNGLEAVVGQRTGVPVVTVAVALRGGAADAPVPGLAELAERVLERGHRHGEPADVGARAAATLEAHAVLYRVEAGAQHLGRALDLVADHVRTASLPGRGPARLLAERAASADPFDLSFRAALYGPLPREAIDEDTLRRWVARLYRPSRATLAIVGDVEPAEAERLLRAAFGGWKEPPPEREGEVQVRFSDRVRLETPPPPPPYRPVPTVLAVAGPPRTQARVALGCQIAEAADPDLDPVLAEVAVAILARRAEPLLRRVGGGDLATFAQPPGGGGRIEIRFRLPQNGVAPVLAELEDLVTPDRLSIEEIDRARWSVAHRFAVGRTTTGAIALSVLATRVAQRPLWFGDQLPARAASLGQDVVERALRACRATRVLGVLGDGATSRTVCAAGICSR